MRSLFLSWIVAGLIAGFFARALLAEMVAQEQAVAIELQSKRDWLVALEQDRTELIARNGPYDKRVANLTQMIKATKGKIKRLESEMDEKAR